MRLAKKPAPQTMRMQDIRRIRRKRPSSTADTQPVSGTHIPAPAASSGRRLRKALIALIVVVFFLGAFGGAWVGWKFVSNGIKIFGWNGFVSLVTPQELKGEDEGRVNILLAGNSADDPGHEGATLTDSIMVASINIRKNKGYIMSIPRDLYVYIPGYGYAKINEAYHYGQTDGFNESGYAKGGMGLLAKVVSLNLGSPIHYYALINYTALQQAVDAVGGVDVMVESSDPRGLHDSSPDLTNGNQPLVDLPNGPAHLSGRQVLNLARARGSARGSYGFDRGDFVRTEHQRRILLALKDKSASASTLSNPLRLGQLFDTLGNNVQTDLRLGEIRRLYTLTKSIHGNDIKSAGLGDRAEGNLLETYKTRTGQSALIPSAGIDDYSGIQTYMRSLETIY